MTTTCKITLNTILTEALRLGLVDIWQVITWQVNGVDSDRICSELVQKIEQARVDAQQDRKKQDELHVFLSKALAAGVIDLTTSIRWSQEGVADDIRTITEQQIARVQAQA